MKKKYDVNWKLKHNGKKYIKGDVVELDLPEHTVKSGVVSEVVIVTAVPIDEDPMKNKTLGMPFIEALEDVERLNALLVAEKDGDERKWALEALEARITEVTKED